MEACLWLETLIQVVSQPHLISNSPSAFFTLIMTKLNLPIRRATSFKTGKLSLHWWDVLKVCFLFYFVFETRSYCAAETNLELAVQSRLELRNPLLPFSKSWACRHVPPQPYPALVFLLCCVSHIVITQEKVIVIDGSHQGAVTKRRRVFGVWCLSLYFCKLRHKVVVLQHGLFGIPIKHSDSMCPLSYHSCFLPTNSVLLDGSKVANQ